MLKKRTRVTDDGLPSQAILDIILEMKAFEGTQKEKRREFSVKYPDFEDRYPSLFAMACEPDFDVNMLKYMIGLREKVLTNEASLEVASKEVGQTMFDKYVKGFVESTPDTSKN